MSIAEKILLLWSGLGVMFNFACVVSSWRKPPQGAFRLLLLFLSGPLSWFLILAIDDKRLDF